MIAYLGLFFDLVSMFVSSTLWHLFVIPIICLVVVYLSIYVIWQIITIYWR